MKPVFRLLGGFLLLGLLRTSAYAADAESPRSISLLLGPTYESGDQATLGGIRMLFSTTPRWSFGFEFDGWHTSTDRDSEFVQPPGLPAADYQTSAYRKHSTVGLAVARWAMTTSWVQPYLLGGLGFNSTQMDWSGLAPGATFTTSFSERKQGIAATGGLGMHVSLIADLFVGLEAREMVLGNSYLKTGFDASTVSTFSLLGELGAKF